VRGPFLPAYVGDSFRWTDVFTSRLNTKVKLVGPTISCGPVPHIQSYLIATDVVGMEILHESGALNCYRTQAEAVKYAEIGGTQAILGRNYKIDSLMIRNQKLDWSEPKNRNCNERMNPGSQFHYDGMSLNPLERSDSLTAIGIMFCWP
jgi:hypothetical protein